MRIAGLLLPIVAMVSAVPADAAPLAFACRVEGAEKIVPPIPAAAVCARFQAAVDAALGGKSRGVGDAAVSAGAGRWVRLEVTIKGPSIAIATLSHRLAGQVVTHDPITYSVSDRQLGPDLIRQFAEAVAGMIPTR